MSHRRIYWLHALSPTHAGTGRGVGYIDLPIDRDAVTHWPLIRGSGFKGVWRDWAESEKKPHIDLAFGKADDAGQQANSGALIPTDAKLVCLPVRSFYGTFAWCTSPMCLAMLHRTLSLAGMKLPTAAPPLPQDDEALYPQGGSAVQERGKIFLEELDFRAKSCATTNGWADLLAQWVFPSETAWQDLFKKRLVVLPDVAFDFLCETGTEVHTRVRIDDETKTVASGALWTEESLPVETILAGVVQCDRVFQNKNNGGANGVSERTLLDAFATKELHLQIGGKATVGRGQMRCVFTPVGGAAQ
jgi:CRISPR-associated protein Cmr4